MPGAAVLLYEGFRYETLEHVLPGVPAEVGNVMVAVLVLLLTYAFVGSQLFRIAQEALANVRKHARAERAWASIRHPQPAVLLLEIGDDGVGFDPRQARRGTASAFGLASMRERAEVLGGTVRVDSAPGAGTRILVRVPLDSRAIEREEARGDALASAAG